VSDLRDLAPAVQRCRRIADLDADPSAVDATLAADPLLAPLVAATPGLRAPGAADADEVVTRAVLGQQVSLRAARTAWSQLAARLGDPLPSECAFDGLELVFPSPEVIAQSDPSALRGPARRAATLLAANAAIASGAVPLDAGADRAATRAALMDIAIGPWTADYVVMRVPDHACCRRMSLRRGAELLLPAALDDHACRWSPWRSVAVHHLWRGVIHPTTDPRMVST
jgi:AraC family transcriptional regulator of adaptative response / DNA-3-methyladenine glycosylase II